MLDQVAAWDIPFSFGGEARVALCGTAVCCMLETHQVQENRLAGALQKMASSSSDKKEARGQFFNAPKADYNYWKGYEDCLKARFHALHT